MLTGKQLLAEESTSGHKTVSISNVYLHSKHNPIEEAHSFARGVFEKYKNEKAFLVLGLGLGYQIDALIELFEENRTRLPSIMIVEPNSQLIDLISSDNMQKYKNHQITILCHTEVERYFSDEAILSFLVRRPKLVCWNGSFSANREWFEAFLKFEAPNSLTKVIDLSKYELLRDHLENNISQDFRNLEIVELIKSKKITNRFDHLLKAAAIYAGESR